MSASIEQPGNSTPPPADLPYWQGMLKSAPARRSGSGVPSPPGEAMHRMSRATLVQPKSLLAPMGLTIALAGLLATPAMAAAAARATAPASAAIAPWEASAFTADPG